MGADLYRTGHEAIRKAARPQWEAAIAHRNIVHEQAERDGTLRYTEDAIQWAPNVIAPPEAVAAQQAVDAASETMNPPSHYFRDSYNASSLFWKLGLSWWDDLEDYVGPNGDGVMTQTLIDGEGPYDDFSLYPAGIRKLIAVLEERARALRTLPDDERTYFEEKLQRLTAFLHDAAEAGDTIYCSV